MPKSSRNHNVTSWHKSTNNKSIGFERLQCINVEASGWRSHDDCGTGRHIDHTSHMYGLTMFDPSSSVVWAARKALFRVRSHNIDQCSSKTVRCSDAIHTHTAQICGNKGQQLCYALLPCAAVHFRMACRRPSFKQLPAWT